MTITSGIIDAGLRPGFYSSAKWPDMVFLALPLHLLPSAHTDSPVHFPEAIPMMLELWSEAAKYEDTVNEDIEASLFSVLSKEDFWTGVLSLTNA